MYRLIANCVLGFLILLAPVVKSEVIDSAANGFHIRIAVEADVPQGEAYRQFLRVGEWWDSEHTWFGDAARLYIEPRAGGCFCEKSGEQSVLHMLISFVKPGSQVKMLGGLGSLQEMGLHGAMSFTFEPVTPERTRVVHEYRVTGYTKGGLQQLAKIVDGVQTMQLNRLKSALE